MDRSVLAVACIAFAMLSACTKKDEEVVNRTERTSDSFEFKPSVPASAPTAAASAASAPGTAAHETSRPAATGKPFEYKPNPKYFPDAAKKAAS